jgi:ElaB/YqjD/DUF883 family membrane-anchored ribosome-binding protein
MSTLVRDAQALFREATSASGERADELRHKGLMLLDAAMEKAQDAQVVAVEAGKEVAHQADFFVRANPWRAVAISTGVGLLAGLLLSRK